MRYRCLSCGAPLEIDPEVSIVRCDYCHSTSHRQPGIRDHGRPGPAKRWAAGALALSVATLAIVLYQGALHDEPAPAPAPPAPPALPAAPARPATPDPEPTRQTPPAEPAGAETPPAAAAPAGASVDPGAVLGKNGAKKVLEPALLACMKKAGVHYLVTNLGQGYEARTTGPVAPLRFVHGSWVDYHEIEDLAETELGRCILEAASQVKTRAFKGNYIYFGLRDPDRPDPLADAPKGLPHQETTETLGAYDGEARDCMRRFPDSAPIGESISLHIEFRGVDGVPVRIQVFYQDPESPYTRCVVEAYSQARSPRFRGLTGKTTHHLSP